MIRIVGIIIGTVGILMLVGSVLGALFVQPPITQLTGLFVSGCILTAIGGIIVIIKT